MQAPVKLNGKLDGGRIISIDRAKLSSFRVSAKAATVPNPFLPLSFFAAGVLALGIAALTSILGALNALALLHLVAVGAFATIAMGALYQFIPVVGMQPLRGTSFGFVHLALAIAGTTLMVAGFARGAFDVVAFGGIAHLLGALLEASVLACTLCAGSSVITARGAALALAGFIATATLGVVVAARIARGLDTSRAIAAHRALGLAGFFGTLIVAVTFRLLRMFERYNLEERAVWREVAVALTAVLAALWPRLGLPLLVVVAQVFAYDLAMVARHRNPAYQRETFLYAAVSGAAGCAATVAAVAGDGERATTLALWLFAGTAVLGYLQRIVPFIWWIHRSRREGAHRIPTLGQMNETRLGHAVLAIWVVGGVCDTISPHKRGVGWPALAAWVGLLVQLARPFVLPARAATQGGS